MNFFFSMFALLIATSIASEQTSYIGYKLVKFTVNDKTLVGLMHSIEETDEEQGFDIWNIQPITDGMEVTVLLSPNVFNKYTSMFSAKNAKLEIVSHNVQDLIDYQLKTMELTYAKGGQRNIIFKYARYSEIINFIQETAENNPTIATTSVIGYSHEGRELRVIRFKAPGTPANQRAIFIDCGIHAREWVTLASCVYIVNQIVQEYNNPGPNPQNIRNFLSRYEIHILPILNPDGYDYTWTSRLWRKNRSPNSGSTCMGTDLNRNCNFRWFTGGSSNLPCSDTYAGSRADSERESQALVSYIQTKNNLWDAYITIHSYGQWWLLSYGDTTSSANRPPNYAAQLANGNLGAQAILNQYGTRFVVGQSSQLLYVTSGSTSDCMLGRFNIPYTYTLELAPGQNSPDAGFGFTLPEDRLVRVCPETWLGVKTSIFDIADTLSSGWSG